MLDKIFVGQDYSWDKIFVTLKISSLLSDIVMSDKVCGIQDGYETKQGIKRKIEEKTC